MTNNDLLVWFLSGALLDVLQQIRILLSLFILYGKYGTYRNFLHGGINFIKLHSYNSIFCNNIEILLKHHERHPPPSYNDQF